MCEGLLEVHGSPYQNIGRKAVSELSSDQNSEHVDNAFGDTLSASNLRSETTDETDHKQQLGQSNSKPEKRDRMLVSKSETTNARALRFESKFVVEFVHRTASDFLRNSGPGRDFLEANSPPDFDIEFSYVKLLLGEIKLATSGYIVSHVTVDEIMEEVNSAEDRTGKAQIKSCDLIERTMEILDLSHPKWCSNSHWCARWGRLANMLARGRRMSRLSSASNSRSSSRDSFCSAPTEPATPDYCNIRTQASISFISFAASHGLSHYVQLMLGSHENSVGPEMLDCMLYCSVYSTSWYRPPFLRSLELTPELLRRGANPNAVFFTKTIWEEFLDFLDEMIGEDLEMYTLRDESLLQAITSALFGFVKYGADVRNIWTLHVHARFARMLNTTTQSPSLTSCTFDLKGSGLSMIQSRLKGESKNPQIQKMCTAMGAISCLRCRILQVGLLSPTEEDTEYLKQYELSEKESAELVKLYEHWLASEAYAGMSSQIMSSQIIRLCVRFDEDRSNPSKCSATDNFVARVSEQGSTWDTSNCLLEPYTIGFEVHKSYIRSNGVSRWQVVPGSRVNRNLTQTFFDALSSQPPPHNYDSSDED